MFKRVLVSVVFVLVVFSGFWAFAFTPQPDLRIHGPIIKNKNGTSTNWSGYAVYNSGLTSDVKGSWTVPSVDCTGVTQNTYSSTWVGIDGYNDSSVEQTGTEHDCINGSPSYYAWYEMYPKPGYKVPLNVKAGDVITGEVSYSNGKFVLTLVNSAGGKFTTSQKSGKAQRQSAEWVVEAPWSGGVLPLANFGTEAFAASTAVVGGNTGPISSFATIDRIDMVASNGVTLKAQTSGIGTGGDNFTVSWKSN